jgi:glutamyl/glutaminyl-tRNA synthetase
VNYRGRIAPSPTGYLHLGHARTFWTAYQRALEHHGTLIFRNEDLDPHRSKPEYTAAMLEDLRWLGIEWQEGPDVGGPHAPYAQSARYDLYRRDWKLLVERGYVYPCTCSRKELALTAQAPNEGDEEPIYPGNCRPAPGTKCDARDPQGMNWRFRVPDGETLSFVDQNLGPRSYVAGTDFGDFVVWRRDDVPAYQLAVVTDDCDMGVTEVVRGEDLLVSTARQLLILNALNRRAPAYFHCPLLRNRAGQRLAKRSDALSLRELRKKGYTAGQIREMWA